jgi:pimeloyl-ACP methyl ester carboxylesterase
MFPAFQKVAAVAAFTALTTFAGSKAPARTCSFSVKVTGKGQPILLIPGLQSSGEVWNGVAEHLSAHYQVHVLTLAGFAGEPAIPGLHLSAVRDDIISYIRDNRLARPIVAGHSLGGFLALWIAASAPDLPDRVIAVDGLPFLPALMDPEATAESSRSGAEKIRSMYASMDGAQLVGISKMALSSMITEEKNVAVALEWARRSDPSFVGQAVYDLMTTDLRDQMQNIRVPVLLIGAAKAFASDQERLAAVRAAYERQIAGVPHHKLEMDPNALHFIMLDDPEYLFGAIDRFLTEAPADAR